jgi:hypothetical protein
MKIIKPQECKFYLLTLPDIKVPETMDELLDEWLRLFPEEKKYLGTAIKNKE